MNTDKLKDKILAASRADAIPAGTSGLWSVCKWAIAKPLEVRRNNGRSVWIEPGSYTNLFRKTLANLHTEDLGELVMHDEPHELRKHLQFMLAARGRVLVTGLGLGCVVRGLLANPAVSFVVVIERDTSVLKLVAPYMPKARLSIICADALTWCEENAGSFDCAWHDIWTDETAGEQHLALAHQKLLIAMSKKVLFQGAWEFPREIRRVMPGCI